MIRLSPDEIRLDAVVSSKADAIRQVGRLLVDTGHIQAGYVDSMAGREQQANTYLGNGIAIPHGMPKDRGMILETGIAVLQVPNGVSWNEGETVRLVVGIAAKSDEHLQILTNLTHVLDDPAAVEKLARTDDPQVIIRRLTQAAGSGPAATAEEFDHSVNLVIEEGTGLHARPATTFAEIAKGFEAEIQVRYGDQSGNAKSLMSLLKLGVPSGGQITVMAKGHDAATALEALQEAVEEGLEDEDEAEAPQLEVPALELESEAVNGVAASPGIAIAPLWFYARSQITYADTAEDAEAEASRLEAAIAQAKDDLSEVYRTVKARSGKGKAAIFQAHREFLDDPELVADAIARLRPNRSAPWAWEQVIENRASSLEQLDDPVLSGRAADVQDVGQRVLRRLVEADEGFQFPDHPVLLIAEDLAPSDTASFDPDRIAGFCTARGGGTSHTAIIARSLNIPAVVGAGSSVMNLEAGQTVVLDGDGGRIFPQPSDADLETARQAQEQRQAQQDIEHQTRFQPALTRDGYRVEVVANIGGPAEAAQAVEAGGEGVGLLRTEFLFLNRDQPPSEEEQYAALTQMTQALNGLPLIVRTLDIGGDKSVPYLDMAPEENPFLGVRGVRLCLERTDLFET
ncbi:PTS fructose transporter subunit IIA, partial [filamentous cyanobacterium CCP5]